MAGVVYECALLLRPYLELYLDGLLGQTVPMEIDSLLEMVEAKVVCGQCGNQTAHTIAWLKTNGAYECPVCGDETDLRTQEWTDRIQGYIDACTGFEE